MYVLFNGKIIPKTKAKVSIYDHSFLYGDGVYETLRTGKKNVLFFDEHFDRLKKSTKYVGIKFPWSKKKVKEWIEVLLKRNKLSNARIRITVSRGKCDFNFMISKPRIFITTERIKPIPVEVYEKGVKVVTFPIERPAPMIKSISMVPSILAHREAMNQDAFEAILYDGYGNITEGSMTNVFMVKNGVLTTANDFILEGTVRNHILELLEKNNVVKKIETREIEYEEFFKADEVFITSTLKGVVPVVKVDDKKIGKGKVGEYTQKIMDMYFDSVNLSIS